jgi:hypothetical protein
MGLNLFSILNSGVFSIKSIISPFFPISHGLGFITTYIYLYLLSPLLNHFINKVNKKEYTIILLIFAMLTFYYGFLFKGAINPDGYNNIMNFIFLYLIGRYIALYTTSDTGSWNKKILYAVIFSACSFLIAGSVIIICKLNLNKTWISSWSYPLNSPLVMISSIAFFLFFRTLKIKSKLINWLACSVLSIFLIHENPVIKDTIYQYVNETGKQISNGFLLAGYLFILAIGIMIICIFIDKIRIFIMNPVERMIGKINVEKYMNIMIDKIENIIK